MEGVSARRGSLIGCALSALVVLLAPAGASAATITTSTTADEFGTGAGCSLREAVQAANLNAAFGGCGAGSGADTVALRPGTYTLTIPPDGSPDDNADGDLDLQGATVTDFTRASSGQARILGGTFDRLIDQTSGNSTASVNGLVLQGGLIDGSGGAVHARGVFHINNSTLVGNRVGSHGGAIAARSNAQVQVVNSTLSGNTAEGDGGAIDSDGPGATTVFINSTVTANTADVEGNSSGGGGGLNNEQGSIAVKNSIVAGNTDAGGEDPDCNGAVATQGGNIVGTATGCGFVALATDRTGVAPRLGPLAGNGGPTPTHALLPGSPALNAAIAGAPPVDRRGAPRQRPDIGAYERVLCGRVLVNIVGTAGRDKLKGTKRADGILGLGGKDKLKGAKGNDGLCGGGGRDQLRGGPGVDRLVGQGGADLLIGGGAKDRCKGGAGRDTQRAC